MPTPPPRPVKVRVHNLRPLTVADLKDSGRRLFICMATKPKPPFHMAVLEVKLSTTPDVSIPVRVGTHSVWVDLEELFDDETKASNALFNYCRRHLPHEPTHAIYQIGNPALDKLTAYRVTL